MTIQHTPGPWKVGGGIPFTSFGIFGPDGETLSESYGHIPGETFIPTEANAHLIAAAPELLEALEKMFEIAQDGHYTGNDAWDCFKEEFEGVIALIAKAKGETS